MAREVLLRLPELGSFEDLLRPSRIEVASLLRLSRYRPPSRIGRLGSTVLTIQILAVPTRSYFSSSWTAFQADRGRRFSGIVDDGVGAQVIF